MDPSKLLSGTGMGLVQGHLAAQQLLDEAWATCATGRRFPLSRFGRSGNGGLQKNTTWRTGGRVKTQWICWHLFFCVLFDSGICFRVSAEFEPFFLQEQVKKLQDEIQDILGLVFCELDR